MALVAHLRCVRCCNIYTHRNPGWSSTDVHVAIKNKGTIKLMSIPRLELWASVLLAHLLEKTKKAMELNEEKCLLGRTLK